MSRLQSIPIRPGTGISVTQAARYVGVSDDTIRRWCDRFGLGSQLYEGGHYRVSAPALAAFVANDDAALTALRAGSFDHPHVKPYMAARFEAGARVG